MDELSFTWNGLSSEEFGVKVLRLPDVISPGIRGTAQRIPGRDGTLFSGEDALEEIVLLTECYLPYEQGGQVATLDEIRQWLRGIGWFTQSDVPDRKFRARITDAISFQPLMVGFADRVFGLTLYADPYQYEDPDPTDIILTETGFVNNPGTAASRPRIAIEGSGDITLVIGRCIMVFDGLTDGIVVDSELMECLNLTETQLMNANADIEEFPLLQPGANSVMWSGEVTRIVISPRWRYR